MTKIDFASSKNQDRAFMHIQIVLNILCQFFAHTLHITFNKHVNYMSIGLIIVIDYENWFRVFEESSQAFMHIQIVLNILCQFSAHTLATVTFNIRVNYISIGSLIVLLLVIDDENWFCVFEQVFMHIQIVLNILCQFCTHIGNSYV